MGKGDAINTTESVEKTDANQPDSAADVSQSLLDDAFDRLMLKRRHDGNPDGIGRIHHITLPPGWVPGREANNKVAASSYKEFQPADNSEVDLCFYYRGRRTSDAAGKNFQSILDKPPHILSPSELDTLRQTIRDKANPEDFRMLSARTEELNGKKVLIVEGRYNKLQKDTYAIFLDSDGTGTAVQEIYYQAPRDQYMRYLKPARDSMRSIEWK